MKRFLTLIIYLSVLCGFVFANEPQFVVVIDPGHGGRDGGAVRGTYKEKDINLAVAKILGDFIEDNHKDVKVIFTRKKDNFVDLKKRAAIANKAKANLFISIHTNSTAAKTTTASGADTYILGLTRSAENLEVAKRENSVILLEDDYSTKYQGFDPKSPESYIIFEFMTNKYMEQSLQFAGFVQKDFKNMAKRNDRGVRQAGFLVLRETSMPSVLIELGFINNPTEAKYLSSRLGQRSMASAIYSGFKNYKQDFDKRQGNPSYTHNNSKNSEQPEIIVEETIEEEKSTPIIKETVQEKTVIKTTVDKKEDIKEVKPKTTNQPEYRVQFLVSDKKLPNNSPLLKGLSPVDYYKEGNNYKYTYGATTNYNEILKIQKQVRIKFKDAFVIRFKDGQRMK